MHCVCVRCQYPNVAAEMGRFWLYYAGKWHGKSSEIYSFLPYNVGKLHQKGRKCSLFCHVMLRNCIKQIENVLFFTRLYWETELKENEKYKFMIFVMSQNNCRQFINSLQHDLVNNIVIFVDGYALFFLFGRW